MLRIVLAFVVLLALLAAFVVLWSSINRLLLGEAATPSQAVLALALAPS